jgi:putative membrane protein
LCPNKTGGRRLFHQTIGFKNHAMNQPANKLLEKKLNRIAWVITAVVLLLVGMMRRVRIDSDIDFSFLPPLYSAMNALTALILMAGLYFIKTKQPAKHQKAMTIAIFSSLLFLLGYVLYHFTTDETKFGGEGTIRYLYFFLLITHVVLAAVIFPFILFTFIRAYTRQFDRHKKMARWVYWVWLYVALTGPVLYFMIKPFYKV